MIVDQVQPTSILSPRSESTAQSADEQRDNIPPPTPPTNGWTVTGRITFVSNCPELCLVTPVLMMQCHCISITMASPDLFVSLDVAATFKDGPLFQPKVGRCDQSAAYRSATLTLISTTRSARLVTNDESRRMGPLGPLDPQPGDRVR